MKLSILAVAVLAVASFSANASDETDVMLAKNDIATNFQKLGMLTDSFTEQGQITGGLYMAEEFVKPLNEFIIKSINNGSDCHSIMKDVEARTENGLHDLMFKDRKSTPAIERGFNRLTRAIVNYSAVQCEYLAE